LNNDPTSKFQELEIGSDLTFKKRKIKICKADFLQAKKNVKSKIAQNLSYQEPHTVASVGASASHF